MEAAERSEAAARVSVSERPPLPLPESVWDLVLHRAALSPDAQMLCDERGRSLTFAELRDAAETTAAGLAAHGVGAGARVSWQLPTSLEACVLMFALARLGALQNPIVPILRRREVGFIAAQTRAQFLVVPGPRPNCDFRELARDVAKQVGCEVLVLDDCDPAANRFGLRLPCGDPSRLPAAPVAASAAGRSSTRWIYYTSGTTAEPKGVCHSDATVLAASNAFAHSGWFGADDILVIPIPIAHIGGIMLAEVQLRSGCRALLVESFDALRTPRVAAEVGMTILIGNAAVFRAYLAAQRARGAQPLYPKLRIAANGGSPRPAGVHLAVQNLLGGAGTMSGWGLTECPSPTAGSVGDSDDLLARCEGRPGPGVELSVVAADGGDCAPGREGELRLRAPQLFLGYVDASLDAAAFDERGRFKTGDLGVCEARGHLRITGRIKDIILRNGENLSALEIEQALALHPAIADVAVIGLPDARSGERACAFVVRAANSAELTLADLAAHCRALGLAAQKVPEQLEWIDAIPRNDLGKIDKRSLRRRLEGDRESRTRAEGHAA